MRRLSSRVFGASVGFRGQAVPSVAQSRRQPPARGTPFSSNHTLSIPHTVQAHRFPPCARRHGREPERRSGEAASPHAGTGITYTRDTGERALFRRSGYHHYQQKPPPPPPPPCQPPLPPSSITLHHPPPTKSKKKNEKTHNTPFENKTDRTERVQSSLVESFGSVGLLISASTLPSFDLRAARSTTPRHTTVAGCRARDQSSRARYAERETGREKEGAEREFRIPLDGRRRDTWRARGALVAPFFNRILGGGERHRKGGTEKRGGRAKRGRDWSKQI